MNQTGVLFHSQVQRPSHPVPRRYIEPMLFLAERMASMDKITTTSHKRMVDELAEAVNISHPKAQRWFKDLNDDKACARMDLNTVKRGVLVVLSLVMKSDTGMGEEPKAYFTKIRTLLGAEPVAVPVELEEHKALALRYLRD